MLKLSISSKFYTIIFLCLVALSTLPVVLINCLNDKYGLKSTHNKYIENLTSEEQFLYPLRVKAKAPYYVIGTSRTRYIDYDRLSSYLGQHCIRLGLSSAMIDEWIFLIEQIKSHSSHFILGFDAFSLNSNGFQNGSRLQDTFHQNVAIDDYLNFKLAAKSIKDYFNTQPYDAFFTEFDKQTFIFSPQSIEESFFINPDKWHPHFTHFDIDEEKIHTLANLTDSKDIIIIFPKYFSHYKNFQKYDDIEKQYFKAITYLITHTNAKIWSFYGINSITLDKDNFDNEGWHFKPKVSALMLARIFNDKAIEVPADFGMLLTKENVESYLSSLSTQIKTYHIQPKHIKD
ncbi:hypothetical protein OQH61_08280 [Helicobacter sp. MIT 21-1697]|uniref:hypothetical protein n=1 Tax=Helicobacter sp. MIT 21-1697 TaxID=2993733 RepID=UPI00224A8ED5|nr:hypothetical protein [Helicobacter sp. MIT 21-1697]MCX2717730.1 hypothetical protein [Helicobacter sp. MIT 21-1697]